MTGPGSCGGWASTLLGCLMIHATGMDARTKRAVYTFGTTLDPGFVRTGGKCKSKKNRSHESIIRRLNFPFSRSRFKSFTLSLSKTLMMVCFPGAPNGCPETLSYLRLLARTPGSVCMCSCGVDSLRASKKQTKKKTLAHLIAVPSSNPSRLCWHKPLAHPIAVPSPNPSRLCWPVPRWA